MVVDNGFLVDGQDGRVVPMGFAWRKPMVELELDLDGVLRGDEQETMDLRPFIDDWEELLFEEDFLFVCVEPMDAKAWAGSVCALHFRRTTIPCGDNYGDGALRQWLTLDPRFPFLIRIAAADGVMLSRMRIHRADVMFTACVEMIGGPMCELAFIDFFKTGIFQKFDGWQGEG